MTTGHCSRCTEGPVLTLSHVFSGTVGPTGMDALPSGECTAA